MDEHLPLLIILAVSLAAQTAAAAIALYQMGNVAGRYRVVWGCVALALTLMVERRLAPLWRLIHSGEPASFADSVFGVLISLLMCAGIYGIRRLFVELNELALTDTLTGLANRRNTLRRAQQELERAQRTGRTMALLMFDLDHFKQVNDHHGHPAGDVVLRTVADIARGEFRRIDTVGRIGGEEFLVVLPESTKEDAIAVAERLRQAVAGKVFSFAKVQFSITISIGVVAPEVGRDNLTLEEAIRAVDNALYQAKETGRNRVVFVDWANRSAPTIDAPAPQ